MSFNLKLATLSLLVVSCILGSSACATKRQAAKTQEGQPKAAVEVQSGREESAKQLGEDQELARRMELEKMKNEEREKSAQAAQGAPASAGFIGSLERVYFNFDKSDLTAQSHKTLEMDAQIIKGDSDPRRVVVEGHCDERGTAEYNLALGERRAAAVKKYLLSLGVSPKRLLTVSFGQERPVDPAHNQSAWSKNRRVQFSQE